MYITRIDTQVVLAFVCLGFECWDGLTVTRVGIVELW